MKINNFLPYLVIIILLIFIWFKGCEREIQIIEVPGESGSFDTITEFVYIERRDTVFVTKWDSVEIETKNPVNTQLVEQYQTAKDSLERMELYLNAIEERQFREIFDNEFVTIDVSGTVRGEILGLTSSYDIKPRTIQAPGTRFRLLGGFQIGNSIELSRFRWKASLGLQNGQGNIFRFGYGDNETIWLGYEASLLNF